ncbi:MAG: maltotransferase domain-containing protein [Candidatus Aminicenantes bacterium]
MNCEGRIRVVIENITPEINGGRYPVKRAAGEAVSVEADIYADGHDHITAVLLFRRSEDTEWREIPMSHLSNDRWQGEFQVTRTGTYLYTIKGWVDHFRTWQKDLKKKFNAGQDVRVELKIGAGLVSEASRRAENPERDALKRWSHILLRAKNPPEDMAAALSPELRELMQRHPPDKWISVYERELRVAVERP